MHILLTGGAGYIGTHTAVELLNAGHDVIIVDNLHNSCEEAVRRVEKITNKKIVFYTLDVRDKHGLDTVFENHSIEAVIHFAGLKAVGESVEKPLEYYENNIDSSIVLLNTMAKHKVNKLVFSSSATVYGAADSPYVESAITGQGIANPYAQTKYVIEQILRDQATASPDSQFVALRYFNPVGAHSSGLIGEDPKGTPNNLMPFVAQVASGTRPELTIYGNDYPTIDGTCVRDFIHVTDVARGHLTALEHLKKGFDVYNLGSGSGTSVLQIVNAFSKACGYDIPYKIGPRRAGDLPEYYANATKAKQELSWKTNKSIDEICADTWRWQSNNPRGYNGTR